MFDEWQATAVAEGTSTEHTVAVPGTPAQLAGSDGVTYRTTFDDPRDEEEDVAVLELRGLYAHSEVEITGTCLVGEWPIEHDAYFAPLRIPFVPHEDEGNELVVTCYEPRDRFGGIHDTDLIPGDDTVPGIWWDVSLESTTLPFIESMDVTPVVAEDDVHLDVSTTVVSSEPFEDSITYSVKPEGDLKSRGMMQRASIDIPGPGRTTVEHTVDVHDPALWWPRGYGSQNRYQLRGKLADTELTVTTGIRDVSFADGELFVNGEQVPIRGVNLVTADEDDIDRALAVNANLVRAHAQALPETVYEACDRNGILVWQDLPLTGPEEFDSDRGQELATALSRTYGNHPSLVAFAVHDDPLDEFIDGLGSGFFDRLRLRWRAWRSEYDPSGAERIAAALPEHIPTFPVVGGPGIDNDAAAYYPGWDYGTAGDIDRLLNRYPASMVAEYGAAAITEADDTAEVPFDRAKLDRYVDSDDASPAYQADVVRTITEYLRSTGVGAIPFCLRDPAGAGMGLFTRDGTAKPASDTLESAFEPTQAFVDDPTARSAEISIVNDRNNGLTATLAWAAGEEADSTDVTIPAQGRMTAETIAVPNDADSLTLTLETEYGDVVNEYDLSEN